MEIVNATHANILVLIANREVKNKMLATKYEIINCGEFSIPLTITGSKNDGGPKKIAAMLSRFESLIIRNFKT